jgi:biopolymer transport protein TolR
MSHGSGFSFQINVTPLIDVLLVMLIIFMVIVPVMPHGLAAALPSTGRSSIVGATPDQPIMVQVELRSSRVLYRMNGVRVDKGQIGPLMLELLSRQATRRMLLTADAGLDFGVVAEVIDAGQTAGVDSVGLITPGVQASARQY